MAVRHVLINRAPESVWNVLSDGAKYQDWVVGTRDTQQVGTSWPAVGSEIRYQLRVGRWSFEGRTVVRYCAEGERLELEAQAGPLGTARIAIEVRPWGEVSLVVLDEHPLSGPGAHLHNMVIDALLQVRHRRMLSQLASVVERCTPAPSPAPAGADM